jgi:hypothetical protein
LEMAGNKTQKEEKSRDETQRRRRRRRIPNNEDIYNIYYVLLESTIHAVMHSMSLYTQPKHFNWFRVTRSFVFTELFHPLHNKVFIIIIIQSSTI